MLKFKSKLVLLPGQIAIKEILRLERKMWKRNKKKMKRQCLVYFVSWSVPFKHEYALYLNELNDKIWKTKDICQFNLISNLFQTL